VDNDEIEEGLEYLESSIVAAGSLSNCFSLRNVSNCLFQHSLNDLSVSVYSLDNRIYHCLSTR
jgi:hypothetical protein